MIYEVSPFGNFCANGCRLALVCGLTGKPIGENKDKHSISFNQVEEFKPHIALDRVLAVVAIYSEHKQEKA